MVIDIVWFDAWQNSLVSLFVMCIILYQIWIMILLNELDYFQSILFHLC